MVGNTELHIFSPSTGFIAERYVIDGGLPVKQLKQESETDNHTRFIPLE
nr:MAG TPA: hypothetical protein [Bacteriophage sp.]